MTRLNIIETIKFKFDPFDKTIMTMTAEEDGVQIKQMDYFYKNEISVTTNGATHIIETPNIPFIILSFVIILFVLISFTKLLIEIFIQKLD